MQTIVTRLRERGHRLTPQRLAVVSALVGGGDHPSAEQVYERVRAQYPMMSPATVYKAIDTLKAAGEVLELEFREGPNRYDATRPTAHPHVICTACGRIEDVQASDALAGVVELANRSGFRLSHYRLDFFGLCPSCEAE